MFKIIHHFIGDEGILREIKWLNKDQDTPKEELYEWQWLRFGSREIEKLSFESANGNNRYFKEGTIAFTHLGCHFSYLGQTLQMTRLS